MVHIRNVFTITEYLLLSVLALSTGCLAAAIVQISDNREEVVSHFSSRSLLDTWDDDFNKKFRNTYERSSSEKVFYFFACFIIFAIALTCRFCIKYGCNDVENETSQGTVLHPPPRTAGTVVPPPYNYGSSPSNSSNLGLVNSGNALAPPSNSRSIILPYEGESMNFPTYHYGIENPNYQPINVNSEQYSNVILIPEPPRQNQTPLCDIMDMPPSYDTVAKEDFKYPKTTSKS